MNLSEEPRQSAAAVARAEPDAKVETVGLLALWPAALMFSVIFLLPFSRLSAIPMAIMLVSGLVVVANAGPAFWRRDAVQLYLLIFIAFWVPTVLSCFDAVAPSRSWQSAMAFLRFVPVGLFVIFYLANLHQRLALWRWTSLLVMVWCVDALVQMAVGTNTLGMPMSSDRLNGVFGESNIKLGHVLAVLAPLPLEYARRFLGRVAFALTLGLLLAVIVLVSTRAAWIMFGLVLLAYVYLYARGRPRRWLKATVVLSTALALMIGAGYQVSPALSERLDRSMLLLKGDEASVDQALGWRLPIWRTAARMAADHPINGVGVRGFRYAYPDFAESQDRWLGGRAGTGAAHAHQVVLEVLTETGLAGLAGLLLALAAAWRHWRGLSVTAKHRVLPLAMALGVMLFPINTHLAFYSTFWSLLCWWLVMVYCGYSQSPSRGKTMSGSIADVKA